MRPAGDQGEYTDEELLAIYGTIRTVAMVGASPNWNRPSYFVMKYLQRKGYRVIPVNPGRRRARRSWASASTPDLAEIPEPVDVVDIFRRPPTPCPASSDEAIDIGAKVVWMQLGVRNRRPRPRAEAAGLTVVQDRCMKIEYGRLSGELAWSGVELGDHHQPPPERLWTGERPRRPGTAGDRPRADPADAVRYGIETRAVHAGTPPDPVTGARNMPIYQTTSYVFEDVDHAASLFNLQTFGYIYRRITNPTVAALEERVASLEGGRAAVAVRVRPRRAAGRASTRCWSRATSSSRRATCTAARITQFTPHVPAARLDVPLRGLAGPGGGPRGDHAAGPRRSSSRACRTPAAVVADLEGLADVAHEAGIPLIVDNTLARPYLCRPFEWGADIVIHSMTKFLSGHGTSMGGIVVESGRFDWARTASSRD